VFVSAIVPNIEEINAWLGGTEDSVVRSEYRPAISDFAVLEPRGTGVNTVCHVDMHPHLDEPLRYRIDGFLQRDDFAYTSEETGRRRTYSFTSYKTRAVAACRKVLPMGSVVLFAANKKGSQGAEGLAEELVNQLSHGLGLPNPREWCDEEALTRTFDYLRDEYGQEWIGTQVLGCGAILHHGDIPQETREAIELLLRNRKCLMAICTNTLAEGVNLPIRTLVLYSVQRRLVTGRSEDLLTRDIKNLVGRAGRAGATTRGLVLCTNPGQWPLVGQVADQAAGEEVVGALRSLLELVSRQLAEQSLALTNDLLERSPAVHSLIDGLDATLMDLAALEVGEERFREIALAIAEQTFAYEYTAEEGRSLLREVIRLRSDRILTIRNAGRLEWVRSTGARPRMIELVESKLLPAFLRWQEVTDPLDPELVDAIVAWAWRLPEVQETARRHFGLERRAALAEPQERFGRALQSWLRGATHREIAQVIGADVSQWLSIYTGVVAYAFQTVAEQGVALLDQLLLSRDQEPAPAVHAFTEHLRFGVPTRTGLALASAGVRHRKAYVAVGDAIDATDAEGVSVNELARDLSERLQIGRAAWQERLGELVYGNTITDLESIAGRAV
jgi:hypothetical protein